MAVNDDPGSKAGRIWPKTIPGSVKQREMASGLVGKVTDRPGSGLRREVIWLERKRTEQLCSEQVGQEEE